MNRISNSQLFSILLCVKAFGLICSAEAADASLMAGAAISTALQFLFALPMIFLYRQKDFSLAGEMLLGSFGKIIYALFFIMEGAVAFNSLWKVSRSVYFPVDSSLMCAVILAAVCLYCASMKLPALARASLITTGVLVFSAAVMILGAYSKADPNNYIPATTLPDTMKCAVRNFCSSGEPVMLFILLDSSKGDGHKGAAAFFAGSLIMTELVYIIEITVLGKVIHLSDFPFFTAGAFSQPLSIQRADSLYMIVFALVCVLTVTLQLILTSQLIGQALPDLKYGSLASVILMLGLSALLNSLQADLSPLTGVLVPLLSAAVPLIMLIRRLKKGEKSYGNTNTPDTLRVRS